MTSPIAQVFWASAADTAMTSATWRSEHGKAVHEYGAVVDLNFISAHHDDRCVALGPGRQGQVHRILQRQYGCPGAPGRD